MGLSSGDGASLIAIPSPHFSQSTATYHLSGSTYLVACMMRSFLLCSPPTSPSKIISCHRYRCLNNKKAAPRGTARLPTPAASVRPIEPNDRKHIMASQSPPGSAAPRGDSASGSASDGVGPSSVPIGNASRDPGPKIPQGRRTSTSYQEAPHRIEPTGQFPHCKTPAPIHETGLHTEKPVAVGLMRRTAEGKTQTKRRTTMLTDFAGLHESSKRRSP